MQQHLSLWFVFHVHMQAILEQYKSDISRLTLVELDREMVRKLADFIDSQGYEFLSMTGSDASKTQSIHFSKERKAHATAGATTDVSDAAADFAAVHAVLHTSAAVADSSTSSDAAAKLELRSEQLQQADGDALQDTASKPVAPVAAAVAQGAPLPIDIIRQDVLAAELPAFDVLLSNAPYNISRALLTKLVQLCPTYRCAVLLLQDEFVSKVRSMNNQLYCTFSSIVFAAILSSNPIAHIVLRCC
jgi:hypothetical protein